MGYILCKDAEAERPYYVKDLGINLYSAFELCYFIYNHSALLGDDFPDEELLRFIGDGCRMPDLERKLRKWKLHPIRFTSTGCVAMIGRSRQCPKNCMNKPKLSVTSLFTV